jgi:hypothetical protein
MRVLVTETEVEALFRTDRGLIHTVERSYVCDPVTGEKFIEVAFGDPAPQQPDDWQIAMTLVANP